MKNFSKPARLPFGDEGTQAMSTLLCRLLQSASCPEDRRYHRGQQVPATFLPSCSMQSCCCSRPAHRCIAGATARPTSSKAGLGFEAVGLWTPQTHLPVRVRSGILQCLGCRALCFKTRTLARDLQNGDNLNARSPGGTVAGMRVTQHPAWAAAGRDWDTSRKNCSGNWTWTTAFAMGGVTP